MVFYLITNEIFVFPDFVKQLGVIIKMVFLFSLHVFFIYIKTTLMFCVIDAHLTIYAGSIPSPCSDIKSSAIFDSNTL